MQKNKNRNIIITALIVLIIAVAAFFGIKSTNNNSSNNDNENSVSVIKKRGTLRVAVFGDLPPYGWVDDHGNRVGYDVRLARQMAKDMGVKVKFTQVNANNRVDTLNSNKADIVLANFTETPERKQVVDFAKPYMKVSVGVISPKSAPITSAQQLKGKNLIVNKGTTAENYFTKKGGVDLLKFDSKTQQFNAFKNKRAAALADDNSYLYAWVKKNPNYTVGIKNIGPNQFIAPAVKQGNKSLLNWTNKEITRLANRKFFTDDYNKELKPYFGKEVRPSDIVLN